MRFARSMPAASRTRTWAGGFSPAAAALSAGTRLSSTSVVLPEPDTPVTAVSRPRGTSTARGFTVWSASVSKWMRPRSNTWAASARARTCTVRAPDRNGPMSESGSASISGTEPCAITRPPAAPAPGPISTMQSVSLRMRASWSTITTELPSARRSRMTSTRPSTFTGCSPMDGSSST